MEYLLVMPFEVFPYRMLSYSNSQQAFVLLFIFKIYRFMKKNLELFHPYAAGIDIGSTHFYLNAG